MKKTWVIIANGSTASIYEAKAKHDLSLIHTFSHEESRMSGTDLKSDRPGRAHEIVGAKRHAMAETTPPKEVEIQRFALEIANFLDDSRKHNLVESIYLAAPPHFLGLLQSALSDHVSNMVAETVSKDFTALPETELTQKINISTIG